MSNFDKAVDVLGRQGWGCGGCGRLPTEPVDECYECEEEVTNAVKQLADAGLLKTEFEESELSRLYGMETVVERGIRKGSLNECEFEGYL